MRQLPDDPEQLKEIIRSMESQTRAWWDIKAQNEAELKTVIVDAVKGYLRTSRNGGMPKKQSDMVEIVLEEVAGQMMFAIWPIILRVAEKYRNELEVPTTIPDRDAELDAILGYLDRATEDKALRDTLGYSSVLMAMIKLRELQQTQP